MKYLRADVALRQSYDLPPDAAIKLETALQSLLDSEDEKLVTAASDALVEFDHGVSLEYCNWAMSTEDGPSANTSHRGAIRELVAVSGLRAGLRFRAGDAQGALLDALAALAAARYLTTDGSLVSVLIGYKLENLISSILAQQLNSLSPTQLKKLETEIDALPKGSSLRKALESEKVNRDDLTSGAKTRDELLSRLLQRVPYLPSEPSSSGARIALSESGDPQQILANVHSRRDDRSFRREGRLLAVAVQPDRFRSQPFHELISTQDKVGRKVPPASRLDIRSGNRIISTPILTDAYSKTVSVSNL